MLELDQQEWTRQKYVWVLSRVQLFTTPWTVALQALVHEIPQARILEEVAIPFSGGSSHPEFEPQSPALQENSLLSNVDFFKKKKRKKDNGGSKTP